jgi:hypothetical protein
LRPFANIVFVAGEFLNLESVLLKACHRILPTSIASLDTIESFTAHPASNACSTILHRKQDAIREIPGWLPERYQCRRRLLLDRSDVAFGVHDVVLDLHGVSS